MISRNAFETANCDRLVFNTTAPASWLAWTVADPPKDAWKHVRLTIFHVRIAELPLGNHANVCWNVGVGGTAPLAIDDLVEVLGICGVCWLHSDDKPAQSLLPGT